MDTILKCILVDDEKNSRIVLRDLLFNFCKEIEIIGEASNVETAAKLVNELKPDLVFLDIQMPTGNGFTLLQKYNELPFDVIFVTSYDQYAINAIRFSALDYLLKPVDVERLKESVQRAVKNFKNKISRKTQIINLLQNVDPSVTDKKIALHSGDIVRYMKISDIVCIEGDVNYSHIFAINGEKFSSAKTLKDFEDYFSDFDFFLRIHRGVIVNTHYIHHYSKGDPFIIEMTNGKKYEASRRKKSEVLERLKNK